MTSFWSLTIVSLTFLINFAQATYDASAHTNLAVYWVRFPVLKKTYTQLTFLRDKEHINSGFFAFATNLPSI